MKAKYDIKPVLRSAVGVATIASSPLAALAQKNIYTNKGDKINVTQTVPIKKLSDYSWKTLMDPYFKAIDEKRGPEVEITNPFHDADGRIWAESVEKPGEWCVREDDGWRYAQRPALRSIPIPADIRAAQKSSQSDALTEELPAPPGHPETNQTQTVTAPPKGEEDAIDNAIRCGLEAYVGNEFSTNGIEGAFVARYKDADKGWKLVAEGTSESAYQVAAAGAIFDMSKYDIDGTIAIYSGKIGDEDHTGVSLDLRKSIANGKNGNLLWDVSAGLGIYAFNYGEDEKAQGVNANLVFNAEKGRWIGRASVDGFYDSDADEETHLEARLGGGFTFSGPRTLEQSERDIRNHIHTHGLGVVRSGITRPRGLDLSGLDNDGAITTTSGGGGSGGGGSGGGGGGPIVPPTGGEPDEDWGDGTNVSGYAVSPILDQRPVIRQKIGVRRR